MLGLRDFGQFHAVVENNDIEANEAGELLASQNLLEDAAGIRHWRRGSRHRITASSEGADWCLGRDVEDGVDDELLTEESLTVIRVDALGP